MWVTVWPGSDSRVFLNESRKCGLVGKTGVVGKYRKGLVRFPDGESGQFRSAERIIEADEIAGLQGVPLHEKHLMIGKAGILIGGDTVAKA
jgi:hypothetical protein